MPETYSLRTYLTVKVALQTETNWMVAADTVDLTAIQHPEWDLDERRTWQEWEEWSKS